MWQETRERLTKEGRICYRRFGGCGDPSPVLCLCWYYKLPASFSPLLVQYVGWSDFFFIWQKMALNQRSGMILEVQIQILGARAAKFSFLKNSRGLNINIFFVNISMKLPFTSKTNAEKQIQNLSFKNYYFGPPKKRVSGFWRKTPKFFFGFFGIGLLKS